MSSMQQNDPIIWAGSAGIRGYDRWAGVSDDIMDSSNGPIGRAVNNCHHFRLNSVGYSAERK